MRNFRVRLVVEPCDLWIGAYVDPERQRLYILPVPCVGLVIEWGRRCRVCGCTERAACPGGCYWVAEDVCSACVVFDDDEDEVCGNVPPASPDGPPIRPRHMTGGL